MPRFRTPTSLESQLNAMASSFAAQVATLVRADFGQEIRRLLEGGSVPVLRLPSATANGAVNGVGRRWTGRPRAKLDENTIDRVYGFIKENPSKRTDQIYAELGFAPKLVKKALLKLREDRRVHVKGKKRGTTYTAA